MAVGLGFPAECPHSLSRRLESPSNLGVMGSGASGLHLGQSQRPLRSLKRTVQVVREVNVCHLGSIPEEDELAPLDKKLCWQDTDRLSKSEILRVPR